VHRPAGCAGQQGGGVDCDVIALLGVEAREAADDERLGRDPQGLPVRRARLWLGAAQPTSIAFATTSTRSAGTPDSTSERRVPSDTASTAATSRAARR
jgi:hypothetical protein